MTPGDVQTFVRLEIEASRRASCAHFDPETRLRIDGKGLRRADLVRLARSLRIASIAGLVEHEAAAVATVIAGRMGDGSYAELDQDELWLSALAGAREHADMSSQDRWSERERNVGGAFRRLRERGIEISISGIGPHLTDSGDRRVVEQVSSLVRILGGVECTGQIFSAMEAVGQVHDGFLVFGERVASRLGEVEPAIPWASLLDLARDFAATYDCQRYSQFAMIADIDPEEFERVAMETIVWRELFCTPQTSNLMPSRLGAALATCCTVADELNLGFRAADLRRELEALPISCQRYGLALKHRAQVEAANPILWKLGLGQRGEANRGYRLPSDANLRNHERRLFFETAQGPIAMLPATITSNAACEIVVRTIWERLPRDRAADLVGSLLETVIYDACARRRPDYLRKDIRYLDQDANGLQLDVGTADGPDIVLFETKAKSLTAEARSGSERDVLADYADSYLALLSQLARHEAQLRSDALSIPIATRSDEEVGRVTKVAVSPLTFGGLMDRLLTSKVMPAILQAQFASLDSDPLERKKVEKFNKATAKVLRRLDDVADHDAEGRIDLFPYFLDVFWMDLGQLVCALDRAPTVAAAFRPVRHLTFGSRDFWTEIAFLDRQLLNDRHGWRQPA